MSIDTICYEEPEPLNFEKVNQIFAEGDPYKMGPALIAAVLGGEDWQWCQSACLNFLKHDALNLRRNALTCLGHLARMHGKLDRKTIGIIIKLRDDEDVGGYAHDALSDIRMYLKYSGYCYWGLSRLKKIDISWRRSHFKMNIRMSSDYYGKYYWKQLWLWNGEYL